MPAVPLTVLNAAEATFDCSFGRGCDGKCCRNGRPSLSPAEVVRVETVLARVVPLLRPDAAKVVAKGGFLSARTKIGQPMLRVSMGWCVLFNEGCVLHKIGIEDGDALQYKPTQCALFPLEPLGDGKWYVRQWGQQGEKWDLFCLNPANTPKPAVETLAPEIELAARLQSDELW